jgi:hypothetical protein
MSSPRGFVETLENLPFSAEHEKTSKKIVKKPKRVKETADCGSVR